MLATLSKTRQPVVASLTETTKVDGVEMPISMEAFLIAIGNRFRRPIRTDLISPNSGFLGPQTYNSLVGLHGLTMILATAVFGVSLLIGVAIGAANIIALISVTDTARYQGIVALEGKDLVIRQGAPELPATCIKCGRPANHRQARS